MSASSQQIKRPGLADAVKRYLRRTDFSQLVLRQRWQREVARQLLRATRSAWSTHGTRLQPDLCIKKYVVRGSRSIFAPIPKVGTRTVELIFAGLARERADIEARLDRLEAIRVGELSDYRIFSLVRNPWSRALSVYQDKVCQSHKLGNLAILSRYQGLRPGMSFVEFVEWLGSEAGADDRADRHWLSQSIILESALDLPETSGFIGRFENFATDLSAIMARMGLPVDQIPRRNVTLAAPGKEAYRDFYSTTTRSIIAERYARDIAVFGYEF